MTVTFGRLGRAFLLAGVMSAVLTLLSLLLPHGSASQAIVISLGVLALVGLVQGVVWTVLQQRMFGSLASLQRVSAQGLPASATINQVRRSSSKIGADAIAKLDLTIHGQQVTRHVRIPFNYAAEVRPGKVLPVRVDPEGSHAMIVDWDRLT